MTTSQIGAENVEGRPASFPPDERGFTLPNGFATAQWPAQRMRKRNAPSWTGSQRQLFSLVLYLYGCVQSEMRRAAASPDLPQSALTPAANERINDLLGLSLSHGLNAGERRSYHMASGSLARRIARPPINRAGEWNLPGGGTCWYYAVPSSGLAARWIAGGGEMGPIADAVLGPPPGLPGLPTSPDPQTGKPSWLSWSVEDLLGFMGLDPLGCKGYFAGLRRDFTEVGDILTAARIRCGEAAASITVPEPQAPLSSPPDAKRFPWGWVALGLAGYTLVQTGIVKALVDRKAER